VSNPDISRFRLLDNGVPERVTEINTDGLPVALVIVMQTGGSASHFLSTYRDLPDLIGRLVGGSVHEISLVTFDSRVEEIWHFPARTDGLDYALTHLHSGDEGAAIKDAVAFGVRQLQGEPGRFRRIVLLISRGADVGSSTSSQSLLEQLGTSSTVVYSLIFPSGRTQNTRAHKRKRSHSADEELKRASRALNNQTAEEIAYLTGGTDFQFDDQRSFNSAMLETISNFHDGISLGFQPSHSAVGFHRIDLQVEHRGLKVTSRRAYWWAVPK
jgi:VWFA-related protein